MKLPWSKKTADEADMPRKSGLMRAASLSWLLLSWAGTLAVVVAMVAVIGFVAAPRIMGWDGVIVLSGSMKPALETGDIVFVEPATPAEVKVGDILTFRREGTKKSLITHRVMAIEVTDKGREFTTQGDANTSPDNATVKEAQVIGIVNHRVPQAGRVVDFLHDQTNYYVFIGIPAALLILNEIWSIGAELRKSRGRREPEDEMASVKGAWS